MNDLKTLYTFFCVTLSVILALSGLAQEAKREFYSNEVSFTNENDAYLFQKKDAYYSNGFLIKLHKAGEKKGNKIIQTYELGQMIFTPLIRKTTGPADIDRPYGGYMYAAYHHTHFNRQKEILQYKMSLGIVGPASLGEEVQFSYHKFLHFAQFTGWNYQIQNSIGIDLGIRYTKTVLEDSSWFAFLPSAELNLGNTFTNAKLGTYLCLGSFEKNSNSVLWNAKVQKTSTQTRRNHELFLYWFPQIILQVYNATVEGGMFNKGSGAALGETVPWMVQQNLGLFFAQDRWTTKLEWIYQSKEANTQKNAQQYVSLQLGYRFH